MTDWLLALLAVRGDINGIGNWPKTERQRQVLYHLCGIGGIHGVGRVRIGEFYYHGEDEC